MFGLLSQLHSQSRSDPGLSKVVYLFCGLGPMRIDSNKNTQFDELGALLFVSRRSIFSREKKGYSYIQLPTDETLRVLLKRNDRAHII